MTTITKVSLEELLDAEVKETLIKHNLLNLALGIPKGGK